MLIDGKAYETNDGCETWEQVADLGDEIIDIEIIKGSYYALIDYVIYTYDSVAGQWPFYYAKYNQNNLNGLSSLKFRNNRYYLLVKTDTTTSIFESENLNEEWILLTTSFNANSIEIVDGDNIFVCKDNLNIQKFVPDSASWNDQMTYLSNNYRVSKYRDFEKIVMADSERGFVIGENKLIMRTLNGGGDWELLSYLQDYGTSGFLSSQFVNDSCGFVLPKKNNTIFRTTNSGATWLPNIVDQMYKQTISNFPGSWFWNEKEGIFFNYYTDMAVTNDGGRSFQYLENSYIRDYFNTPVIVLDNDNNLKIIGNYGVNDTSGANYIKTTILNFNYKSKSFTANHDVTDLEGIIINAGLRIEDKYYFCGLKVINEPYSNSGIILSSEDSLKTFKKIVFEDEFVLRDIFYFTEERAFAIGQPGKIITTNDGWKNRNEIMLDTSKLSFPMGIAKINENEFFIVGYGDSKIAIYNHEKKEVKYFEDYYFNKVNYFHISNGGQNYYYITGRDGMSPTFKPGVFARIEKKNGSITHVESKIENSNIKTVWVDDIYPNPVTSAVRFNVIWQIGSDVNNVSLNIYNIFGINVNDISYLLHSAANATVYRNYTEVEYTPYDIPSGIYIIVVNDGRTTKSEKFVYIK